MLPKHKTRMGHNAIRVSQPSAGQTASAPLLVCAERVRWVVQDSKWRPGVVLDPFAGSGTVLAVATGHGRDAIGIDLDERNAHLAQERVGMFLTVETPKGAECPEAVA